MNLAQPLVCKVQQVSPDIPPARKNYATLLRTMGRDKEADKLKEGT
jgi:hypothetical protein